MKIVNYVEVQNLSNNSSLSLTFTCKFIQCLNPNSRGIICWQDINSIWQLLAHKELQDVGWKENHTFKTALE